MRHTLSILVVALGWLACSGLGLRSDAKVSEAERLDYAAALSVLSEDPDAAAPRLVAFIQKWPQSPLSGDASIHLAELALARGDQDAAMRHYDYVIRADDNALGWVTGRNLPREPWRSEDIEVDPGRETGPVTPK